MTKISREEWLGVNEYEPLDWILSAIVLASVIGEMALLVVLFSEPGYKKSTGSSISVLVGIGIAAGTWLGKRRKEHNALRRKHIAAYQSERMQRYGPPPLPAGPRKRTLPRR